MGRRVGPLAFLLALILSGAAPCAAELSVITADELRGLQLTEADVVLWDARDKRSFDAAHITGAALPLSSDFYREAELHAKGLLPQAPDSGAALKEAVKALDRSRVIVTYCNRDCKASQILGMQLEGLGFRNVRWMEEGLQSWEEKGYPITIGAPKLKEN